MTILEGKVALVTGASRGIGAAVARMLADQGVKLGLASRSGDDLGISGAVARPTDVRDRAQVKALVDETVARHGGLDIVVANAGVGAYGPFVDLDPAHIDEMMDVNAKGVDHHAAATVPHLIARGGGDFVSVASEAGRRGLPFEAVYCASKFAQVGFTRALDHELRPQGIRCTNVCPGGVATDFAMEEGRGRTPEMPELAGMMSADDVAEAVLFVLTRPPRPPYPRGRIQAHDRDELGVDDGSEMGNSLDGRHQPKAARRRGGVGRRRRDRGRQPRPRPGRGVRARPGGSSAPTEPTTSCSPTRTWRRSTSRCRTRCTASGRSGRSRPASTCSARSRSAGTSATSSAAFDAAERTGLHLSEAFMYRHHPQTARLTELVASGAIGELRVIRSAFSYSLYDADNIRLRTDVEGGSLMDVGCYCVSGSRLLGGEPESVVGAAQHRLERHRLGVRRPDALPGRRRRRCSTAAPRSRTATSSRRSERRARSSSTTRGTARRP